MQRPGSDDKRPMDDSDRATKAFWKSLIPPDKRRKVSKKEKMKKNLESEPKRRSRKVKEGRKKKKRDSNASADFTQPEQSHVTEESQARKKRVAFELPPVFIHARHPEVVTPPAPGCKEKFLPAVSDSLMDMVNSQDLFITQNNFRASPSDLSSEEVKTPPQSRTVRAKVRTTNKSPQRAIGFSTGTQTENFFTSELSSFLHFKQNASLSAACLDMQPLDLSLPHRSRSGIPADTTGGQQAGARSDEDSSPSNGSQPEAKSVNALTSSDDSERIGRVDLTQVRAVQMRLNESFFFKAKGEAHPPRPEAPLMKLSQGRDGKKTKKLQGSKPT